MNTIRPIDTDTTSEMWNMLAPHPLQSWQWGEARKALHIPVLRFGEYDGDTLKKVYQGTLHKIPYTPYAMTFFSRSEIPSPAFLTYLKTFGRENKIIFYKFEPYTAGDVSINAPELRESPHPLFPKWTMKLDITPDEDTLRANLKPKTRYNIRLAEKKGVTIKEESNEKGFQTFFKLYHETCVRQKYLGHNEQYHKTVWEHMNTGIAHILIAYYNNEPLASYELFHFHDTLYYPYGGSTERHRNVMAPNLIMWEAIKLGKKLGAKTFDMWGSTGPSYDPAGRWGGFTRFKEGYNAQFVELGGSYDYVVNPVLYTLYNSAYTLRDKYIVWKARRQQVLQGISG